MIAAAQPDSAPQPQAGEAPARNKQGELVLNRHELLGLARSADLLPGLMQHLRKNHRQLIRHGVRGAANIGSAKTKTLVGDFILKLPKEAFAQLVDDWLIKQVLPELDKFVKDSKDNEDALRDKLIGLRIAELGLTAQPADAALRAKLMIGCNYRPRFHELMNGVIRAGSERLADEGDELQNSIVQIVAEPGKLKGSKDQARQLHDQLVACAAAIHFQQREAADKLRAQLASEASKHGWKDLIAAIDEHYASTMASGRMPAVKFGMAYDGEFASLRDLEVLAQCTKVEANDDGVRMPFAFSKVLAVKHAGSRQWRELSSQQAEQLFPHMGSIIHFHGNQYPAMPEYRSYAVWRVAEHPRKNSDERQDTSTVHATAQVMPVQQVSSIESISTAQPGELRSWFVSNQSMFTTLPADEAKLLHTADGLFIHPADSYAQALADGFATPFRAWRKLKVHQLSTGLNLHIGELPDGNMKCDLASAEQIVAKSLAQYAKLSKLERGKLGAAFEQLADNPHYQALCEEFGADKLRWRADGFQQLVDKLEANPAVKRALEDSASGQQADIQAKRKRLRAELASETASLEQLDQRIAGRIAQVRRAPEEIDALVAKYFDRITGLSNSLQADGSARRKWFPDLSKSLERLDQMIKDLADKADSGTR